VSNLSKFDEREEFGGKRAKSEVAGENSYKGVKYLSDRKFNQVAELGVRQKEDGDAWEGGGLR